MIISQQAQTDFSDQMDDESSLSLHSYRLKARATKRGKEGCSNGLRLAAALGITGVVVVALWMAAGAASDRRWEKEVAQTRKGKAELENNVKKERERAQILELENRELKGTVEKLRTQAITPPKDAGTKATETPKNPLPAQPQKQSGIVSKGAKGAPAGIDNPNVVVDVVYPAGEFLPLPVDFLRKDSSGKGIKEILYPAPDLQVKREDFQKQRVSYLDSKSNFPQVFLTKYNNALEETFQKEGAEANEREWVRLNAKFGLDKVTTELPMCVMVPGYNNNANFRIEYNLNSIFSQNYSNYRVVVINDCSNDGSNEAYRKYFAFHRIDKERYTYIENSKRVTALQNIYVGSMNHCAAEAIVVTLDADDEFIGRNVLKVFNWGYQSKKAGVLYSNFMWYQQGSTLMYGFTSEYTEHERKNNLFRHTPMKFSHLRSFRNELIFQIDPKDLQDDKGVFFTITYDIALFIPLMELACGRVYKVEGEFHYLYTTGTGLNDYNDRGRQVAVENQVRMRKKYECYKDFDRNMSQ